MAESKRNKGVEKNETQDIQAVQARAQCGGSERAGNG